MYNVSKFELLNTQEARANLQDFIMTSDNPVYAIVSADEHKSLMCVKIAAMPCCEIAHEQLHWKLHRVCTYHCKCRLLYNT